MGSKALQRGPRYGRQALQGEWRGTPARLFHTVWDNENEWYQVKQLDWRLQNSDAKLVVSAVTAE